jgi:hypothetical protein
VPLTGVAVSQLLSLEVVHVHPDVVVTLNVPLPPPGATETPNGDNTNVHDAACVTMNVCPPTVIVPARDARVVFAETV